MAETITTEKTTSTPETPEQRPGEQPTTQEAPKAPTRLRIPRCNC